MHDRWIKLCSAYDMTVSDADFLWNFLASLYSTPDRHYHTLDHVIEMIEAAPLLFDYADDYNAVQFAVWFHDVIYNTKRQDNEELSSQVCARLLLPYINRPTYMKAAELIAVTKHHKPLKETDDELIVDLDLMRFADPWEKFCTNNENIRKEYFWVPDNMYAEKRREVLEYFGGLDPMFHTPKFQERYEAQAHHNIERLLTECQK
jgi:predicted metal-dependent HD superfamily phosphohydrolase